MPRKARNERLETRTARLKLPVRREPYFFTLQEGRALGYRRLAGGRGGTWIARRYSQADGRKYRAIGDADDYLDADGSEILTFAQAQAKAAEWFAKANQGSGTAEAAAKPITVGEALDAYLQDYEGRGGKALRSTQQAIEAHIRPALGKKLVNNLSTGAIRSWHQGLAAAPARLRAGKKPSKGRVAVDADSKRARRATANRVLTILKATLNHAFREGNAASDDPWRRVKPFLKVDVARIRYLTDDESRRLLNACPHDMRALATAALLTGCRYGELTALTAADIDGSIGVLTIRTSKSGKPRSVVLTDEAVEFFGQMTAGKSGSALVLMRADGGAWGKSHQFRPLRDACAVARITPPVSFHALRHSYASRLVQRGVPMAVIAAQLGNEERICAKHYAHLAPGYISETVRQAFGRLTVLPDSNVVAIRG